MTPEQKHDLLFVLSALALAVGILLALVSPANAHDLTCSPSGIQATETESDSPTSTAVAIRVYYGYKGGDEFAAASYTGYDVASYAKRPIGQKYSAAWRAGDFGRQMVWMMRLNGSWVFGEQFVYTPSAATAPIPVSIVGTNTLDVSLVDTATVKVAEVTAITNDSLRLVFGLVTILVGFVIGWWAVRG